MENPTPSDKIGHQVSSVNRCTFDEVTSRSSTEVPAQRTQSNLTIRENFQPSTCKTDCPTVASSDGSNPVISSTPTKVFIVLRKDVKQNSQCPSVKHILLQESADKGSRQVVARIVPAAVMQISEKSNTPIYVVNISGNQPGLNGSAQKSKIDACNSSKIPQLPSTFDESSGPTPGESSVPVIESVFSLKGQHPDSFSKVKKVARAGQEPYNDVPESGSSKSQMSTLHEHTLFRMANMDFTRRDRNLKSVFQKLHVNRAIMSFHQLSEVCYAFVKDKMDGLAFLERCEMLLTMKRFVEDFDRYCQMMHPAMMIAMSVYLPDPKDYRMLTWHGIPPLGWLEYSITLIMREVFTIVVHLCSGGREVPPFDTCYFPTNSSKDGDNLRSTEVMFSIPKGEENFLKSTFAWGIKRGQSEMTETCHVSSAKSSASCRNVNVTSTVSTSSSSTTYCASSTVQLTPNVSSVGEMSSCSASNKAPEGMLPGAQKQTSFTSQDSVTSSQENESRRCSPIRKTSTLSEHTNEHACVEKPDDPQDDFSPLNAVSAETNSEPKVVISDLLKGVTHSRLFHAMWFNLAPEECQLQIPDAEMCSLSAYLEEKPLESAAPSIGTVLLVDGKNYDARQVLSEFRRGVVYVKMSKKMFTEENFHQTFSSVRVLPHQIPFQVIQPAVRGMARMIHKDFSDKRFQGVGRPRRNSKGIWPLDKVHCGKRMTSTKRRASTAKGGPTKEVKEVPEKCQRSSQTGDDCFTGTLCNVESKKMNNPGTLRQDSNPTEVQEMASDTVKNGFFAQLVAALTRIPLRLENHEDSKKAMGMVTSLRQTADFLYQTAAEIEKKL